MQKSTRRSQQALSQQTRKLPNHRREVRELLPEFAGLYDDDYIAINEDNLSELERIFNTNINMYHYVDGRARIITAARSQTSKRTTLPFALRALFQHGSSQGRKQR
jgi:hypothetical protein